jgi:hypothetical protein
MPRGTGGEWLASSWTAAGLASGLGRALGGSSPLDPPARDATGDIAVATPEADPFGPLPPLDPDAEWDDVDALDEIPVAEPAQLPLDAFAEAPQEGPADEAPAGDDAPLPLLSDPPEPELLPPPAPEVAPQAAPPERESQPACGVAAAPPGPSTPPNEEEAAAWSSGWDPTQLLSAAQREELAAAAASLRAGLPGGGNPAALVGTALLGTTDGALRGFAGLMNNGRGGNKPRD